MRCIFRILARFSHYRQYNINTPESLFGTKILISPRYLTICILAMSDVKGTIEFLADSPKHKEERPYIYHPGIDDTWSANDPRLTNMSFAAVDVSIRDIRSVPKDDIGLDTSGFAVIKHESSHLDLQDAKGIEYYQKEIEDLLREQFQAEAVICCRSIVSIS